MTPEQIIRDHIPSLTDEDAETIYRISFTEDTDAADLALRTCACGKRIDGFYEYVDHLIDEMHKGLPWS